MNVVKAGSGALPSERRPAGAASIGVRPEHVRLDPDGVSAIVVAAEYLGADTLVETRLDGQSFIARFPGRVEARPSESLPLSWPAEAAHWFGEDGRRIG